jgi:hypothetical protein
MKQNKVSPDPSNATEWKMSDRMKVSEPWPMQVTKTPWWVSGSCNGGYEELYILGYNSPKTKISSKKYTSLQKAEHKKECHDTK